jgi:hypothetical protein
MGSLLLVMGIGSRSHDVLDVDTYDMIRNSMSESEKNASIQNVLFQINNAIQLYQIENGGHPPLYQTP